MSNEEYQRTYYDKHYAGRAAVQAEHLSHSLLCSFFDRLAERVLDEGGPRFRLLEVGCGEGLLGAGLRRVADRRGIELHYTGSDISAEALAIAERACPGTYVTGDAAEVVGRQEPESFDLIVCKNLLHHLPRPRELLGLASRALDRDGRFVAAEAAYGSPQAWFFNVLAPVRERYFFISTKRRNRREFAAGRLEITAEEPFSFLPFELLFVIRPGIFRRLWNPSDVAAVRRVVELDRRLTRRLPALAGYTFWSARRS